MSRDNGLSRRQFLARAAGLGAGLALSACAPKATPAPESKPADTQPVAESVSEPTGAGSPVKVRYMNWWGEFNTMALPQIMDDFKDVHPNVTIVPEEVVYGEAQTKYQTTLVAGTAPDILYHMNFMSQYYTKDMILDLTSHMEADGIDYWNDFYRGLGVDDWCGKIYGFPHMYETCIMLYNKTMIQECWGKDLWEAFPDGNWDISDMVEVAKACSQDTNGDGLMDQWGLYVYHRDYYYGMEVLGWTMGDSIYDVNQLKYNFTSPAVQEVCHMLFDWVRKDKIVISEEELSEVNQASGVYAPFFAGLTAMRIRMSTDVGRAIGTIGDKFDWDVFYLPNHGDKKAVTRAGGHGHNIPKASKVADMAYEFAKFCGTTPGQKYTAQTKQSVPVYRDPELRKMAENGNPPHDSAIIGVLTDRGGYGDHMRFNNEAECLAEFKNEMTLLYTNPYEESKSALSDTLKALEDKLNGMIDYGDDLPFPDLQFPFPPPTM